MCYAVQAVIKETLPKESISQGEKTLIDTNNKDKLHLLGDATIYMYGKTFFIITWELNREGVWRTANTPKWQDLFRDLQARA